MVLHLIVKDFGKIRSADIALNNLVIFVGNNNSGKTMLMQLIYGIRKELKNYPVTVSGAKESVFGGQSLIRCAKEWFQINLKDINLYLEVNKERIVRNIFGTGIPLGEIKIALEDNTSTYYVCSVSDLLSRGEEWKEDIDIDIEQYENGENTKSLKGKISNLNTSGEVVNEAVKMVWRMILAEDVDLDSEQLFLPASRSGLQLLYRYYFAGETKGNMVLPVKDFLRFQQLYSVDLQIDEVRSNLLEFGENNLLNGKIIQKDNETFYVEGQEGKVIPLYIASSMIHELAPFIKALNSTQRINWLYCDEVENSLHPLMQREMARWLIRMVNSGMHVIISSHSDTMASRLNNLLMLTYSIRKKADYAMLSELELLEADLLSVDSKVAAYEFRNGEKERTIVERMEFINYPLMGYDFQLFGKNLDKLYDEAERITRK